MRAVRVLLLAVLLAQLPAHATAPLPQLAGATTIRSARPVSVDVTLPRPAAVRTPFDSSPDLAVAGGGRFVAVALVGTERATHEISLFGGRFPDTAAGVRFLLPLPHYRDGNGGTTLEGEKSYPDEVVMPAGRYRLYLVPDGKPATVTFRFHGLGGRTVLTPTRQASVRLEFPEPRLAGGSGTEAGVYSAGAVFDVAAASLIFHALWIDTTAYAGAQNFLCHRIGPAASDLVPDDSGCSSVDSTYVAADRTPTLNPDAKLYLQGFVPVPKERHGLGFWYATQSMVTDIRYVALEIAL